MGDYLKLQNTCRFHFLRRDTNPNKQGGTEEVTAENTKEQKGRRRVFLCFRLSWLPTSPPGQQPHPQAGTQSWCSLGGAQRRFGITLWPEHISCGAWGICCPWAVLAPGDSSSRAQGMLWGCHCHRQAARHLHFCLALITCSETSAALLFFNN